ncbi:MAG: hypothetical protein CMH65_14815 [Nevskiales bacterium]|nr:hypothetical protein [Nevskiales bacterium]
MFKALLAWLVQAFIRLLNATYRYRFDGQPKRRDPQGADPYLLAIWHQNLFAGILAQTGRRHVVIVSRSGDGDPVTMLCERLGYHVARGSSASRGRDKGGREAKEDMIRQLEAGLPGALTVDGPRGPAHVVKPGIVEMARRTGLPIVPYLPLPQRYWSMKSWDRFRLPKPFTRIDVYYGEPIPVPSELTGAQFEHYQRIVAEAIDALEARHDPHFVPRDHLERPKTGR